MQNKSFYLSELAEKFGLRLKGQNIEIKGVASLEDATSLHLCCIRDDKYVEEAIKSSCGALLVKEGFDKPLNKPLLFGQDPYLSFIKIKKLFTGKIPIHTNSSMVYIHNSANIGKNVEIAPFCYIGANVTIENNVRLHSGVKILDNSFIGDNTEIFQGVTVFEGCKVGRNCIIGVNSVIGGDGFGFHFAKGKHNKVPQSGIVEIGNNVEIGSNVSIDRATFGKTVIGEGSKIDNQVQIGHNVKIGNHVIVVAQSGISGSTEIGDYSILAGKSGLVGHIKVGKGVTIGGASVVTKSVKDGKFVIGYPAVEERQWKRQAIFVAKLPELSKKIKELDKRISKIENAGD
jgi:UDP-3-O-[3-hydroxymyristoyl] glucosamine N-acyltransferase